MQSYPYRLLGNSVRAKALAAIKGLLDAWSEEWFIAPPAYTLRAGEVVSPNADWWLKSNDADHWAAFLLKEQAQREFMHLIFGSTSVGTSSAMVADVMQACMDDLLQRLVADQGTSEQTLPSALRTGEGSGVLYVEIDSGLPVKALMFGGAWVEEASLGALPLPTAAPKLASRHELLGPSKIKVALSLGEAELPLSELAGIAVGDVLTLDVSYRNPLQLRTEDGMNLCKGHLGRVDQRMAIQVTGK